MKAFRIEPKSVGLRKSIDGLFALVELVIRVAVSDPVLFFLLNKSLNCLKILYWGHERLRKQAVLYQRWE